MAGIILEVAKKTVVSCLLMWTLSILSTLSIQLIHYKLLSLSMDEMRIPNSNPYLADGLIQQQLLLETQLQSNLIAHVPGWDIPFSKHGTNMGQFGQFLVSDFRFFMVCLQGVLFGSPATCRLAMERETPLRVSSKHETASGKWQSVLRLTCKLDIQT